MPQRLSPSELLVLIEPNAVSIGHYQCDRCDLTELVFAGWAKVELVHDKIWQLQIEPAGEARLFADHLVSLHYSLYQNSRHAVLSGENGGEEIRSALCRLYPRSYLVDAVVPALMRRKLIEERQIRRLMGLLSRPGRARTLAGEAIGASIERRLDAVVTRLPRLLSEDPALAVACGCAVGTLLVAGLESRKYYSSVAKIVVALQEAARRYSGDPRPAPLEFTLRPEERLWQEMGSAPLTPLALVALIDAMKSVNNLELRPPEHVYVYAPIID